MPETMPSSQQLRDYLLGQMPEDAAASLDARLMQDGSLLRALEHEQQSLIEDLVGDRLSAEETSLFQLQLSRSSALRQKLADFRVLLKAIELDIPVAESRRLHGLWKISLVLSPVLAGLLCILGWIYVRELHRNADLRARLEASESITRTPAQTAVGDKSLFTAFLSANVVRSPSALPVIRVPGETTILEMQVQLHAPLSVNEDWRVELLADDKVSWQTAHTRPRHLGAEVFLSLLLSTNDLRSGIYSIRYAPVSAPRDLHIRQFLFQRADTIKSGEPTPHSLN